MPKKSALENQIPTLLKAATVYGGSYASELKILLDYASVGHIAVVSAMESLQRSAEVPSERKLPPKQSQVKPSSWAERDRAEVGIALLEAAAKGERQLERAKRDYVHNGVPAKTLSLILAQAKKPKLFARRLARLKLLDLGLLEQLAAHYKRVGISVTLAQLQKVTGLK